MKWCIVCVHVHVYICVCYIHVRVQYLNVQYMYMYVWQWYVELNVIPIIFDNFYQTLPCCNSTDKLPGKLEINFSHSYPPTVHTNFKPERL